MGARCGSKQPGAVWISMAVVLSLMVGAADVHAQRGGAGTAAAIPSLEGDPMPKDDAERKILDVIADVDRNERFLSVPREDGRLLRLLVEATGAKRVVELGTSTGYSGLWLCLGLKKTGGKLTTYEIDTSRAATARRNFEQAGVADLVTIVIGDAHEEVTKLEGEVDMVFIDADKEGYLDYLQKLLPHVRPGGLIVAHNMRRPTPDPEFVKAITTDPALESLFLNMHDAGIAVTLKKR